MPEDGACICGVFLLNCEYLNQTQPYSVGQGMNVFPK